MNNYNFDGDDDDDEVIIIISIDEIVLVFTELINEKHLPSSSSCDLCRIVDINNSSKITLRSLYDEKIIYALPSNLLDSGDDWNPTDSLDSFFTAASCTNIDDFETESVCNYAFLYAA